MPEGASEDRAQQLALLTRLIHERVIDDRWMHDFATLGVDDDRPMGDPGLPDTQRGLLRRLWRRYRRATRLPTELVTELARVTSRAQSVWRVARERSEFDHFAPHLRRVIDLTRAVSQQLGWEGHPYDPLLDEYEPWMQTAAVKRVFDDLQPRLTALITRLGEAPRIDNAILHGRYARDAQRQFGSLLLEKLGYDPRRGRLDLSAHPFTTTLGSNDVRITTRFRDDYLPSGIFGIIHEVGHALYEQGIDARYHGGILADGTSLGIHESQSRFWENIIGKSRQFWDYFFPHLQRCFGARLGDTDCDRFWRALNRVEPSPIRIEADEVTYNLHIILRFNLELELIEGTLKADDLPEAWRAQSRRLLGIAPERDAEGVLQDIHWSMGGLGYFPTYALGNLYAAQFLHRQLQDMPQLFELVATGEFEPILAWIGRHIHQFGSARSAVELCSELCGEPLNPDYFMRYLEEKFAVVYDL